MSALSHFATEEEKLKYASGILTYLPQKLRVQVVKHLPLMQHPEQSSSTALCHKYVELLRKQRPNGFKLEPEKASRKPENEPVVLERDEPKIKRKRRN